MADTTASPGGLARRPDGKVDLSAYIGLQASYKVGALEFAVIVNDARIRYGHLDLYVTPRVGLGHRWIQADKLTILNHPAATKMAASFVVDEAAPIVHPYIIKEYA